MTSRHGAGQRADERRAPYDDKNRGDKLLLMGNRLDQVSVVIPVINDPHALDAVLRMLIPFRELEIVVVDGGSDDGSIDEQQPRAPTSR